MEEELKEFIYYMEIGLSKSYNTIRSYENDLYQFLYYMQKNEGIQCFEEINKFKLRSFMAYLRDKEVSNRSINRKISAIRIFFDYLVKRGKLSVNRVRLMKTPKFAEKLPVYLTKAEVIKIIKEIDTSNILGLRDRAIIELLYSSGIRASELLDICEKDIDFTDREIKVIGKGNKQRISFFSENAKYFLKKYIEEKKKEYLNYSNVILFANKRGEKLTDRSLRRIVKKYAKEADIKKEISPHVFRHSFASYLLDKGIDIRFLQELLGHSSLSTTKIYTHISKKMLYRVYNKTHPFAK